MKAAGDHAVVLGWKAEAFARTKRMKPLSEYLKPELPPETKRDAGALDVRRMFERMIVKQEAANGDG